MEKEKVLKALQKQYQKYDELVEELKDAKLEFAVLVNSMEIGHTAEETAQLIDNFVNEKIYYLMDEAAETLMKISKDLLRTKRHHMRYQNHRRLNKIK